MKRLLLLMVMSGVAVTAGAAKTECNIFAQMQSDVCKMDKLSWVEVDYSTKLAAELLEDAKPALERLLRASVRKAIPDWSHEWMKPPGVGFIDTDKEMAWSELAHKTRLKCSIAVRGGEGGWIVASYMRCELASYKQIYADKNPEIMQEWLSILDKDSLEEQIRRSMRKSVQNIADIFYARLAKLESWSAK